MSLFHPGLLWFLPLAVIPIILHFLLKAQPKKLMFPALRLIQVRRQKNVQRMRLRHIWLMLLRIAVIVGIVFALARPRVPAVDYSVRWGEILRFVLIVLLAAGTYFGMLAWWKRQRIPNHVLLHRRSFLRGGVSLSALLLCVLLVFWPFQRRIAAAITEPEKPVGDNIPVAAVLLFDTSLSMQYRQESKTRLELAREIATDYVRRLPAQSRLAVADTASTNPILFQADMAATLSRIANLEVQPVSHPLNDRLRAALNFQNEDQSRILNDAGDVPAEQRQDSYLREIYIFTDLARSAWRRDEASLLKEELAFLESVNVYLIDVGVPQPVNVGLSGVKLSDSTLALGSELIVQATVAATGAAESEPTVELYVENESQKLVKQGQSRVKLSGSEGGLVQFSLRGMTGPVRQGELRLISSDPMPFDDVQYFTVEVQPPPQVLVVSDNRGAAQYWIEALSPTLLQKQGKARWRCKYLPTSKLAKENLKGYAAICLINVNEPRKDDWKKLADYVQQGGGLEVVLGSDVSSTAYNTREAHDILPAELMGHVKFLPPEFLDLQNVSHPLLRKFADWGVAELTSVEIQKYWKVKPLPGSSVIAAYSDGHASPALLERPHGRGRTVLFTTSVSQNGWNDLAVAGWSFLAFADQTLHYLTRQADAQFTYTAGEDVVVKLDAEHAEQKYLLRKPQHQQPFLDVPAGQTTARFHNSPQLDQLGQYRILGADTDSKFERGFSINPAPQENQLARLEPAELDQLLGEKRYSLARSTEDLTRVVRGKSIGREVFPFLVFLMLAAFTTEHLVANRFYDADQRAE